MPIKHNLSKYDKVRDYIHKVSQRDESSYTKDDLLLRNIAILIATFSSGNSWKTHKEISTVTPNFDSSDLKEEFSSAKTQRWRNITAFDISEVAQKGIQGCKFERWLYYNVEVDSRDTYKKAWSSFNEMLENDGVIAEAALTT
jgi:hypothetical protein